MYQLMAFFLWLVFAIAIIISFTGHLSFSPSHIAGSGLYLIIACYSINFFLAKIFSVNPKPYSATITGLILSLIVGPLPLAPNFIPLTLLAAIAMASKYLLVVNQRPLFNPAALAVLTTAFVLKLGASWWIGLPTILPLIVIGGLIVTLRANRIQSTIAFTITYLTVSFITQLSITTWLLPAPIWFFILVMLVEPLTSPNSLKSQIAYGTLVALIYLLLPLFLNTYPYPLETALLLGNLFSFSLRRQNQVKADKSLQSASTT
jgi:Na+-transporting NADH:ubiquinone oxidoreductase subunit NqrB